MLSKLPTDIVISIIQELDAKHLAKLTRTCRELKALVDEFGWNHYVRHNPRPSYSLERARSSWSQKSRAKYDYLTDISWHSARSDPQFVARPLLRQWRAKLQPLLAISIHRLIVASGCDLTFYVFGGSGTSESPPIRLDSQHTLNAAFQARSDITSITILDDDGSSCRILLGFQSGGIEDLRYRSGTLASSLPDFAFIHAEALVQSLRSQDNTLLSLSAYGHAALTDISTSTTSEIQLEQRSWTSHLSLHSSTPFAAFGTSSTTPLTIHLIANASLATEPSTILGYRSKNEDSHHASSVYEICNGPPASPWGASPEVLVSGWYNGCVRCYDLRADLRGPSIPGSPSTLYPVMTVIDPLLVEPIYSVSCGGGSGSHIAAGSARHSVVSFWDVRAPSLGWSVHAPGNDSSPVYDIILESSRLYGTTQSRPFVIDFGPGVTEKTYPRIARNPGRDGLKPKEGSNVGFYVTQYLHRPKLHQSRQA